LLVGGNVIDVTLGTAIHHVAAQTRAMSICVAAKPVNAAPGIHRSDVDFPAKVCARKLSVIGHKLAGWGFTRRLITGLSYRTSK
jgi:hypothetical protein